MKVFLYTLLRTVVFLAVALLAWFLLGWRDAGVIGAVLSIVVGAIVAFAVGYLFFDRQRRAAAEQMGGVMARRQRPDKVTHETEDNDIEDSFQDQQRQAAGLGSEARTRTVSLADDDA